MENKLFKRKKKLIRFDMNQFYLYEYNYWTNYTRFYDLTDSREKEVFQTRIKHYARYSDYKIELSSYLLFYLHYIKWL